MRRHILTALVALSLLGGLAACGETSTTTTQQPTQRPEQAQQQPTQAPTQVPTEKPKSWVAVQTFSGNQNTKTPTFQLNDGDRVRWSAEPTTQYSGLFAVIAYDADGTYLDLLANTMVDKAQSGETNVHSSHKVYFDITASSAKYTITVEEYR